MDELLVPLKTTTANANANASPNQENEPYLLGAKQNLSTPAHRDIRSPEQALEILKSRPQQDELRSVLKWLHPTNSSKNGFDIHGQTLQASQIIHTLVNDVLPSHWSILTGEKTEQGRKASDNIVTILSNVSGISILTSRLKILTSWKENPESNSVVPEMGQAEALANSMSMLEAILKPKTVIGTIWLRLCVSSDLTRKWLLWKELVNLLGNGKVLSTVSEADATLGKLSDNIRDRSWLSDGSKYCTWIGYNLKHMITDSGKDNIDAQKAWVQMLERALTLGHVDQAIEATYEGMINATGDLSVYSSFTRILKGSTKKIVVYSLLRNLANIQTGTSPESAATVAEAHRGIGGIAALLSMLSKDDEDITKLLVEWLSSDGIVQNLQIRRAAIAALAEDVDNLKLSVSDTLRSFGDKLYIKHSPVLHQEGMTENLLLLVGYACRKVPQYIAELAYSSLYLNAISNRLAASSHRVSVLGMYFGTAMSELVDPPGKRINFSSEEMTSSQGQRYLSLTKVRDPLGSIEDIRHNEGKPNPTTRQAKKPAVQENKSQQGNGKVSTGSKIISIEEIDDESGSEDEDLPMYAKPDSDASDSDEDPTVIERNKPTTPVYINDLISGLRDTENYDRHLLALTHASPLIRRKAAFGTEVTDHTEELASILTGLGDKWNIENFQEFRLQGMIAVLVAQPLEMGQWFSRTYFNGDYSIQQRAAVLTTLGLGAREIAGYGKEDMALTKSNPQSSTRDTAPFPSKQFPPKLHALYAFAEPTLTDTPSTTAVITASHTLEKSILQPMALQAADALSGPNALKVRTFSSRMEVEKKRTKPIPNALAKNSPLLGTPLLPLFLKTLALILHASGPSTLPLPLMTTEFLSLLLSLRSHSTGSLPVMEALLFAFLTILEVNGASDQGRRLAAENGKALLEMGEWVEGVLGNVRGDGEEEGRVKALAAGCVGRVREVVEREERVLVGELVGMV
ncbi:MAG: hypothetical protein Q9209_000734 [Squamulea sp. 1 TL-2023]